MDGKAVRGLIALVAVVASTSDGLNSVGEALCTIDPETAASIIRQAAEQVEHAAQLCASVYSTMQESSTDCSSDFLLFSESFTNLIGEIGAALVMIGRSGFRDLPTRRATAVAAEDAKTHLSIASVLAKRLAGTMEIGYHPLAGGAGCSCDDATTDTCRCKPGS